MTGLEALQSVQFVTAKGRRVAVLDLEDWEALVEWLETLEDVQVAREAYDSLRSHDGNREEAGWQDWDNIAGELG